MVSQREAAPDRPLLAISMGDPVGVGPEVIAKALSVAGVRAAADVVVYGDIEAMRIAAELGGVTSEIRRVEAPDRALLCDPRVIPVIPVSSLEAKSLAFGEPTDASDRAQLRYIEDAVAAIRAGRADALVTAPISKASIARAGSPYPGHTEMLGALVGAPDVRPIMMLAGERLKVVLLTTHVPLRDVPAAISPELVRYGIRVTQNAFESFFSRHRARIAVAGLNPHAGEGGLFGDEEERILRPAIEAARAEGILASGPHSGDTVFRRALEGEFDVVIGLYHDQALIPIKLLDFDSAVNVTLGLPIIRTSVDHGTAYDIAGRGVASAGSMISALRMAGEMVRAARASRGFRE